METSCVFCKIIAGTLPSSVIYEDEDTLAFLDIAPIMHGHALVIPKKHYTDLEPTPAALLGKVMETVQKVARAQTRALRADGVNIHQANGTAAGQVVFHLHFHVIPRFAGDNHSWNWNTRPYASPAEMHRLSQEIKAAMPHG